MMRFYVDPKPGRLSQDEFVHTERVTFAWYQGQLRADNDIVFSQAASQLLVRPVQERIGLRPAEQQRFAEIVETIRQDPEGFDPRDVSLEASLVLAMHEMHTEWNEGRY